MLATLDEKEDWLLFLSLCSWCPTSLPHIPSWFCDSSHGAVGRSAVCDRVISWSYSLTFSIYLWVLYLYILGFILHVLMNDIMVPGP